ncbi:MAG: S8 family serine peptidase, partial [Achromobacter sp.]|uniref:S8 family serine peptidase n=1 Tax=Achromobacter sp. TaxID=134375 RepID=UPI0025908A15
SRPLESIGALVARLRRPEGVSSNAALAMLRLREPGSPSGYNYIYRATGNAPETPDDPREPEPSPAKPAKSAIKVGVIDGFSADSVSGWAVDRLVDKPAKAGHGDAVTGILLRDLETGYRVSPNKLMLLDVMREHPGGGAADVAALVFAFDKLVTAKVDVANLSLAGPDHPALRMAVSKSIQKGLVVVAAVGNGGPAAPPAFPAAYDGVVGVAAVDATGKPYIYSGRGAHVDIAALGIEVDTNGTGGELAGTSYAAPHVSALLASMTKVTRPGSVDKLLAQYAEDAGAPGRDPVFGMGILAPDRPARLALAADGKASN